MYFFAKMRQYSDLAYQTDSDVMGVNRAFNDLQMECKMRSWLAFDAINALMFDKNLSKFKNFHTFALQLKNGGVAQVVRA